MGKALVITEKPSVAQDIVNVIGGFQEEDGYWEGEDYLVTYAVGHLFELLTPEEVDEKYKAWTLEVLPILPNGPFQIKPKKGQRDRIRTIKQLHDREDCDSLVNACDAGREGELIFREIAKYLESTKPIRRLWLQSMTTTAIRKGMQSLRPGEEFEGLAASAECRAYSDWLIGMNSTRALTKRFASRKEKTAWSAGRVQTPTLALLVDRELEVLAHVPKAYWRVTATFQHAGAPYTGTWFDPNFQAPEGDEEAREDRIFDQARADAVVAAATGAAGVAEETRKPSKESAPPLFDLTSLQREGNRRFGWSARRTLSSAQRLYERHKLLTYPRTDSRCLPEDYRDTVRGVLESYAGAAAHEHEGFPDYARSAAHLIEAGLENDGKIFNDAGVSDHFAIVPTGGLPGEELTGDDKRLYDLVLRRFLGAFFPPAEWERVERKTQAGGEHFITRERSLKIEGWRSVLPPVASEEEQVTLAPLVAGQDEASGVGVQPGEVASSEEETKPLPRITEARLLSLMENAGKSIEDEDMAAAISEKGLGTPATRAEIIENLIRKGYCVRQGKALRPTVKGIRLIDSLRRINIDRLASPELTGEIEQHLGEVERGERTPEAFMEEVTSYAVEVVERAKTFGYEELYADVEELGPCPSCSRPVVEMAWFYRCREPEEGVEDDCPMRFWKDTSGRYLDPNAVAALCKDGQTPILDGFTARNGRTYRGHIELDREEWKLKVRSDGWNDEAASDIPEYDIDERPLGACPLCKEQIIETATEYSCVARLAADEALAEAKAREAELEPDERKAAVSARRKAAKEAEKPCGYVLPRTVCKREITRDEAQGYLRDGRTELLTDFTSRFGRPFSATLVLQDTGRHGFEFQPRAAGAKKSATGAKAAGKKGGTKKGGTKKAARKKAAKKGRKKAAKKSAKKAATKSAKAAAATATDD